MSIKVSTDVWGRNGLHPTTKLVLLCLAHHAGDNGKCWPSQKTIGEMCGIDERSVRRHLKELDRLGHIERRQRFQDSAVYKIVDTYRTRVSALRPDKSVPRPDTGVLQTGHPCPPNSKEPLIESSLKSAHSKNRVARMFDETDWQLQFAGAAEKHLIGSGKLRKQLAEKDRQSWADTFDKLNRIDQYERSEIINTLKWLFSSDTKDAKFWRGVIQTFGKRLRQKHDGQSKFDKIYTLSRNGDGSNETRTTYELLDLWL